MTDKELVGGCMKGDKICQKTLYERYAQVMFAICYRYSGNYDEASDMMQEGFITVFQKLYQFDFRGSFEGWIKRIMINTCINHLRYRKKMIAFDEIENSDTEQTAVEPAVLSRASVTDVLKAMKHLTPAQRTILSLYAIDGYEHHEIAQILRINESTSRGTLSKARKALAEHLKSLLSVTA